MKEAGRVEQGENRQDRTNGEGGTQRDWKPVLVDLFDLKCCRGRKAHEGSLFEVSVFGPELKRGSSQRDSSEGEGKFKRDVCVGFGVGPGQGRCGKTP
jgi:hypothetical protein